MLCPVSRPIATLVSVMLKDNNRALIGGSGPAADCTKTLIVAQQCFYGKFIQQTTMKIVPTSYSKTFFPTNSYYFHALHIKAELRQ
jgi:hypothetical protein